MSDDDDNDNDENDDDDDDDDNGYFQQFTKFQCNNFIDS